MEQEKIKEIKYYLEQSACMYGNMQKQALTLINHQDFQIRTLKVQVANLEKELKKEQINHLYYRQNSQFKESRIAELEHKCDDCAGCTQWKCDCANIEMHAVKQFAEMLKAKRCVWETDKQVIDETLKEFLCDKHQ